MPPWPSMRGTPEPGQAAEGLAFLVFWCAMVVAITALNTWAAFSANGSLATFTRVPDEDDRTRSAGS